MRLTCAASFSCLSPNAWSIWRIWANSGEDMVAGCD